MQSFHWQDRNWENRRAHPLDRSARVPFASMTEAIASVAVMMLREHGLVDVKARRGIPVRGAADEYMRFFQCKRSRSASPINVDRREYYGVVSRAFLSTRST